MAQNGSSCSNPYVMNLSAGAGDQVFNLNSNDTLFFIKLVGFANKTHLKIEFDTLASNYYLEELRVTNANCNNQEIIMQKKYYARFQTFESSVNSLGVDTVLLALSVGKFTDTLSSQNTINIHIKLKNIYLQSSAMCINPVECDNLLPNGSFEEFSSPSTNFNSINDLYPFFTSYICGWDEEELTADYFSPWFNGGCYQFGPQNICNSQGLNPNLINSPLACGYPAQGSDFFANSESYGALQFGDNGASGGSTSYQSEILKGELTVPLIAGKKYFLEVDIAKPRRLEYGGQLDFDLTDNINFIQNNYLPQTPVTLSVDPFDYDVNLNWRRENTIYQSINGGEKYLYIGNLRLSSINAMPSANGYPLCSQFGGAVYYLFDNIVVKEFFADAGDPDITICSGSTIGGSSCEFPNGAYEWLPSNLFDDNTLYHPTFIGTSNATVSLTVSILMSDGTTQVSDPSYVNITVGVPTITINGSTSIVAGTNTTLTASGASTYTWFDGQNNVLSILDTYITPNLTQTTTYTVVGVDANGCSSTMLVEINTITCSTFSNTVIIQNGWTSTDLKDYLQLYYPNNITQMSSGNSASAYQITSYPPPNDINFLLAGTLTIDNSTGLKFNYTGSYVVPTIFVCFDASNIINNGYLEMVNCSLVACNYMWKGITNNKHLYLNGCYFADAENAVHLRNGSFYNINTNVFENNLYGIFMGGLNGGQISGVDYSNIYRNPNGLKPAYTNMQGYKNRSEAGIKVFNISYVQIGAVPSSLNNYAAITVCNRFEDINCGISIYNSDVKVVNSKFNNIAPFNPSTAGTLLGLQHNGSAIFTSSFSNRVLTVVPIPGYIGYEFENCIYGIKSFRNSVRAVGLRLKTLKYGFDIQNAINCTIQLNENEIKDYSIAGISILGAHNASAINLSYNSINSNIKANRGIRISGALSGGITGNCYIGNNTLKVGADASGGIDVSGMRSPVIQSNHVKKEMYYLAWGNTYGFKGYNFSACDDAMVNCNLATRSLNGGTNIGSDYQFSLSTNSFIKCNNSGASPYGFYFRGPQAGTIFRTNTMGNHSIGLYIGSSGVIGPQPANLADPYEGNKWTGSYSSGFGARNLSIDPNDVNSILDHQFLTNPQDPNFYNPTVNPSIWFAPTTTNPIAPCNILNCPQFRSPLIGNIGFYQAIANRTLITSDYPVETLWMLQGTLYEYLTNDSSLLLQNDSLALFYYNPILEGIKGLKNIKDTLKKGAIDLLPFYAALHGNDSLMQNKANEIAVINEAIVADTLNDSLLIYQRTIKMAQYLLLQQSNEAIYHSINETQEQVAAIAYMQNQEIVPGNVNEAIEKDINEIYLRTIAIGRTNFSASDNQLLKNIAHLCPLAAGPAVYIARDMYALINDTLQYNDSTVCAVEGYFRESATTLYPNLSKKENHSNCFTAQPNPASERVLFTFKANDSTSDLTIYNLSGNIIYSTTLNANTNQLTIDISNFAKGIYVAHVVNNKTSSRIKFMVN